MNRRVLCVDDEPNVLESLERTLFDEFDVTTAVEPQAALELTDSARVFAVVVSDMRMPGMSGVQLLTQIRSKHPDTIRILLTGQADIKDAIKAVNQAGIFRFLYKPCPSDVLIDAIQDGVRHHNLIHSEKQVLEETVSGAVKMLVDLLAIASPSVFNRATRLRKYVQSMLMLSGKDRNWQFELAAQLAQVGCIALPPELVEKVLNGAPLTIRERRIFGKHPETGQRLIGTIPRLEQVAEIVGHQLTRDPQSIESETVRRGVEILQAALSADDRIVRGEPMGATLRRLCETAFPETPVSQASNNERAPGSNVKSVKWEQLRAGMTLAADVHAPGGGLVLPRGRCLSSFDLERLENFADGPGLVEPILIQAEEETSRPE